MTAAEYEAKHEALVESLRPLAISGEWLEIVHACSGSNHSAITGFWALAMTAWFGPVGLHVSREGADGRPDPNKCTDCPRVFVEMRVAGDEIRRRLGVAVLS